MTTSRRLQRLLERGARHFQAQQWAPAAACFESAVAMAPDDASAWLQLSYVQSYLGNYRASHHATLTAQRLQPKHSELQQDLMSRLRTFNESAHLRNWVDRLGADPAASAPVLLMLAGQLSYLNDQSGALKILDRLARSHPDHPSVLVNRGQVLGFFGRVDEAEQDLKRALSVAPGLAQAWWLLSRLRQWSASDNHVDAIRRAQASLPSVGDEAAMFAYALHKELHDLGDYASAWRALESACAAKRTSLDYKALENTRLVDALIHSCDAAFFSEPSQPLEFEAPQPLFIVGMHRSGTTLLERILGGHPDVHNAGELYDFTVQMREACDHHCRGVIDQRIVERAPQVDFRAVGRRYIDGIRWRAPEHQIITDKLPSNFMNIGYIQRALPQARIIHLQRDPVDTCFSNLRELFTQACPYSYRQDEVVAFHRDHDRLMQHWSRVLPERILEVRYESLVSNPEAETRRITEFCGITFVPEMTAVEQRSDAVSTASSSQVRQPIHSRQQPAWHPYRQHLEPVLGAFRR